MPTYQIHRLKAVARQQFRNAPHTIGLMVVKPKDYDKGTTIEAASPYAAWMALRESSEALEVGDLLEAGAGELRIFKFIGFEEAHWYVPEPVPPAAADRPAVAVT